ncbi:MAG: AraC family transcriptional regulator [Bacilli bacterium]|nr:AraC family transcriptional regulator [Bacilli bacterium]
MNQKKNDFRSNAGFAFRHYLTTVDEMSFERVNVSHCHPAYELYYLVSGDVEYIVGGTSYRLKTGDVLLVKAFESHVINVKPTCNYERFVLEFDMGIIPSIKGVNPISDIFISKSSAIYIPAKLVKDSRILQIFESCDQDFLDNSVYTSHLMLGDAIKLISEFRLCFDKTVDLPYQAIEVKAKHQEIINGVSNYIKANLDKKITIDDISNSVFLSKSYLQHLFKQYYGIPVSEYVFIQKMHVAQHMLENGASLAETASALGYKYYSSFCMNYKKYFGIPPKSHHSLNT